MKLTTPITIPASPTEEFVIEDDDFKDPRPQYQSSDSFGDTILKKDIIKPAYNIKHFYLPPPTSPFEDTITPLVPDSSRSSYFDMNSSITPSISRIYNTDHISSGHYEPVSNAFIKSTPSVLAEPQVLTVIQPEIILKEQVLVTAQLQNPESIATTEIIQKSLLNENYVDWAVFSQILEMDEDAVKHEFSRNLLQNYFDQAHQTFQDIEVALAKADAAKIAELAQQLQGSSAALGFSSVSVLCEAINTLGSETTDGDSARLDEIRELYFQVRHTYSDTRFFLEEFFGRSFE